MKTRAICFLFPLVLILLLGAWNFGEPDVEDLPGMRKLSWEGSELTVTLGSNSTTGCEWSAAFEDDSIIGYSLNRKFHPVPNREGQLLGYSKIGFRGKKAGTTVITLTTPCDWEGSGEGYTYVVTVSVGADGVIESAEGKEFTAEELRQEMYDRYANEYSCIGLYYDKHFLSDPDFDEWTTTLGADGGGRIFWGEDNQGPISDWSVEDRDLTIHAGASAIHGKIANGLMILDLGDGIYFAWGTPEVDRDALGIIPMAEYFPAETDK